MSEQGHRLHDVIRSVHRITLAAKEMRAKMDAIEAELERLQRLVKMEEADLAVKCEAIPFDEFVGKLSRRAAIALEKLGIRSSSDIAKLSVLDLRLVPNCGDGTVAAITEALLGYGVALPASRLK